MRKTFIRLFSVTWNPHLNSQHLKWMCLQHMHCSWQSRDLGQPPCTLLISQHLEHCLHAELHDLRFLAWERHNQEGGCMQCQGTAAACSTPCVQLGSRAAKSGAHLCRCCQLQFAAPKPDPRARSHNGFLHTGSRKPSCSGQVSPSLACEREVRLIGVRTPGSERITMHSPQQLAGETVHVPQRHELASPCHLNFRWLHHPGQNLI